MSNFGLPFFPALKDSLVAHLDIKRRGLIFFDWTNLNRPLNSVLRCLISSLTAYVTEFVVLY